VRTSWIEAIDDEVIVPADRWSWWRIAWDAWLSGIGRHNASELYLALCSWLCPNLVDQIFQRRLFAPLLLSRLPYRRIVVFGQDDPYGSSEYAKSCADVWGGTLVDIGRAGHITSREPLSGSHRLHRVGPSLF
jgi:predicted alpha/beta hydrolase family esterase